MLNTNGSLKNIHYGLRLRWGIFTSLSAVWAGLGFLALRQAWTPAGAWRWLGLSLSVLLFQAIVLGRNLDQNVRPGESALLPNLGLGNAVTLLRGMLIAALVGFLFSPRPPGWLAWAPGILYILAIIADFLDGYLARVSNHATRLGEILDMSFDGLGVLVAAALAVQYGQVPVWYLSVALARYLFLAGLWVRKIAGRGNLDLPPSNRRRVFAGLQMGFIGVVLLPVLAPPGTAFAAGLFAVPFLIGFGVDWLYAIGALTPNGLELQNSPFARWGLPALRLAAAGLAGIALLGRTRPPILMVLELGVAILILLGVAGRVNAIAGLILIGVSQQFSGLALHQFLLIAVYTVLLFTGTGVLSLWAPEEKAVQNRLGTPRRAALPERSL